MTSASGKFRRYRPSHTTQQSSRALPLKPVFISTRKRVQRRDVAPQAFRSLSSALVHPHFTRFYASARLKRFTLLDPVRRYKNFDLTTHNTTFLRTENPLRTRRPSHHLKPHPTTKRALLLNTLLSRGRNLKVYPTSHHSSTTPRLNSPLSLFVGRPSLRLLRRERRLYIRMLPQMRLSYKTLKHLRESDVRYSTVKDCYFRYQHTTPRPKTVGRVLNTFKYPTGPSTPFYRNRSRIAALKQLTART